jgi:hypothetical protein
LRHTTILGISVLIALAPTACRPQRIDGRHGLDAYPEPSRVIADFSDDEQRSAALDWLSSYLYYFDGGSAHGSAASRKCDQYVGAIRAIQSKYKDRQSEAYQRFDRRKTQLANNPQFRNSVLERYGIIASGISKKPLPPAIATIDRWSDGPVWFGTVVFLLVWIGPALFIRWVISSDREEMRTVHGSGQSNAGPVSVQIQVPTGRTIQGDPAKGSWGFQVWMTLFVPCAAYYVFLFGSVFPLTGFLRLDWWLTKILIPGAGVIIILSLLAMGQERPRVRRAVEWVYGALVVIAFVNAFGFAGAKFVVWLMGG